MQRVLWSLPVLFALSVPLAQAKPLPSGQLDSAVREDTPAPIANAIRLVEAEKPLSASKALHDLLASGDWPTQESQLQYFLGRSLDQMGLSHAALRAHLAALDGDHGRFALIKAVLLAERLGDNQTLRQLALRTPVEDYPTAARSALLYHRARALLDRGDLADAVQALDGVVPGTPYDARARFLEGVIANQRDARSQAARAFNQVQKDPNADPALRALATLNIARIYYGIRDFEQALSYYRRVPRDSAAWQVALFEGSWAQFMMNNHYRAGGDLLTVQSPFFSDRYLEPEIEILDALMSFYLCDFSSVEQIALSFEARYTTMREELLAMTSLPPEMAWLQYFGEGEETATVLPRAFFVGALEDAALAGTVRHLDQVQRERKLIEAQRADWRAGLGAAVEKTLSRDQAVLERRAGRLLIAEAAQTAKRIDGLVQQSEIIRLETTAAQYDIYRQRLEGQIDLRPDERNNPGVSLWVLNGEPRIVEPFNGEFWEDELGYYLVFPDSSCR